MNYDDDKRKELVDAVNTLSTELEALKKSRFNPFTLGLFIAPAVFFIVLLFALFMLGNVGILLLIILAIVSFTILSIGREVYNDKKEKRIKQIEKEIEDTNIAGYNLIGNCFCELFGITKVMLLDELDLLSNSYPNIVRKSTNTVTTYENGNSHSVVTTTYLFWQYDDCITGVKDLLERKFKARNFTDNEQDLKLQNLQLQNESIAIDNAQKKFWVCDHCGNTNRADDMSCIKCGAIRPVTE